jgi:hypothetical protein
MCPTTAKLFFRIYFPHWQGLSARPLLHRTMTLGHISVMKHF